MNAATQDAGLTLRGAGLVAALLASALLLGEVLRPTHRLAAAKSAIALELQVPTSFAGWRVDHGVLPVLPDPSLQATLDATYSQVLARSYVDAGGRRVMLSIAYSNDQSSEATQVHRPEFCYRGLGFDVSALGRTSLRLPGTNLTVQRLVGRFDSRVEPIAYWLTLDETAALPGLDRKWQQLRHGLQGNIADGMVVRVSTLGPPEGGAFALLTQFITELYVSMPTELRARYFGRNEAS